MKKIKVIDFFKQYKKYITFKEKKDTNKYYFEANNVKDIFNVYFCNQDGRFEKVTEILFYYQQWHIFTEESSGYIGGDFDYLYEEDDDLDAEIDERICVYLDFLNCSILSGTYFIGCSKLDQIKIGFSTNIEERVKQLQTSHPEQLKIYGVVKGRKERKLHKQFEDLRIRGEWFAKTQELKRYILNIHYTDVNPVIAQILEDRKELNQ